MPKREIVYPVFLECCSHCDDVFWEGIFEDLAYGKAPYGTYISKGFLCCSYKGKEFNYKIERKDSKLLYDDIYKLLANKLGILSQKEKKQKSIVFHELERSLKENRQEWSAIRRKNVRDTMYERYAIDMKNKHGLTMSQCKYLLAVLMIGITFKTITAKDIDYSNDRIEKVNGINFKDGEIVLEHPLCHMNDSFSSESVFEEDYEVEEVAKTLSENWHRYLKTLDTDHAI